MTAEPNPAPHLHIVGCADCERLQAQLTAATTDIDGLEKDLKVKRRLITGLKNELYEKWRTDPMYPIAERIWEFWREKVRPAALTFSEDQKRVLLARLKDRNTRDANLPAYTPRYICEAILGAAVDAYVDPKGKRHDDLELICRNGRKLEDFHERWERYKAKQVRSAA
jgi:hypothetical protein